MDGENVTIWIEGLKELQKSMENIAKKLSNGSLVARAALVIERQAKINATGRPGPKVQTGRLRSSITISILGPTMATVGTNVFYAPFVEYGHRQHPGQYVPPLHRRLVANFAPAYPFLGPTIEQTKDKVGDVVVTFGNELGAEWGK
jgi:HK97 gp10 family phage protein